MSLISIAGIARPTAVTPPVKTVKFSKIKVGSAFMVEGEDRILIKTERQSDSNKKFRGAVVLIDPNSSTAGQWVRYNTLKPKNCQPLANVSLTGALQAA